MEAPRGRGEKDANTSTFLTYSERDGQHSHGLYVSELSKDSVKAWALITAQLSFAQTGQWHVPA